MDTGLIATLVTAIITLLTVLGLWKHVKEVLNALKQVSDVGMALDATVGKIENVLADGRVTEEEANEVYAQFKQIGKEVAEARDAIKNLFRKT